MLLLYRMGETLDRLCVKLCAGRTHPGGLVWRGRIKSEPDYTPPTRAPPTHLAVIYSGTSTVAKPNTRPDYWVGPFA